MNSQWKCVIFEFDYVGTLLYSNAAVKIPPHKHNSQLIVKDQWLAPLHNARFRQPDSDYLACAIEVVDATLIK